MAKVCFITAIYGNYESSCKKYVPQTISTDFICFTDNPHITSNGWIIDTIPYHLTCKSPLDDNTMHNSLCNNKHTFNIAKYYKQAFQNIPRLQSYDVIVWLDGTIEIIYNKTSEYILHHIYTHKIMGWNHELRYGKLVNEVIDSAGFYRYNTTFWNGHHQPIQDVVSQYKQYIKDGYTDAFYENLHSHSPHLGVWITCFVAFLHKDKEVNNFLNMWYLQTLKYTTQDQIGFSYVCQKTHIIPFTLPNAEISGERPHHHTQFYIKRNHGL
jgi:hypothetical protein